MRYEWKPDDGANFTPEGFRKLDYVAQANLPKLYVAATADEVFHAIKLRGVWYLLKRSLGALSSEKFKIVDPQSKTMVPIDVRHQWERFMAIKNVTKDLPPEKPTEPASEELCKSLGINPAGVNEVLAMKPKAEPKIVPIAGTGRPAPGLHSAAAMFSEAKALLSQPPYEDREEREMNRTHEDTPPDRDEATELPSKPEAPYTALMEYIANKSKEWWYTPIIARKAEVDFVIDALARLNRVLP